MIALALALAAQAPPTAPVERLCLLAGPSRSLVAVRVVPLPEGYSIEPVAGEVWPFAARSLPLRADAAGRNFRGRDEGGNLVASYQLAMAATGGVTLEVARGDEASGILPVLGGSCAEAASPAADSYLREARDAQPAPRPDAAAFRGAPIAAARDCQVISASGWVSRFNVEYATDGGAGITVRPGDRRLWRASEIRAERGGLPLPPNPGWLRFAFYFRPETGAEMPRGINSIWVYATPDSSQSSARASFFGHDPEGSVSNEDVTGICADFAGGRQLETQQP
jgi:hypothetical protein